MHDLGVAHSDLSLENMLVAAKNVGKIIDFGLCIDMPRNPDGKFAPIGPRGPVGKLFYMAPEVYIGTKPYWGHLADVWSCGVMLFIMLTGGMRLCTWVASNGADVCVPRQSRFSSTPPALLTSALL